MNDEIMTYIAARLLALAFEKTGTHIEKLYGRTKWRDCLTFEDFTDVKFWILWYDDPVTQSTHTVKMTTKKLFSF